MRKVKGRRVSRSRDNDGPYLTPHPFNGADPERLRDALKGFGITQAAEFPTHLADLRNTLRQVHPLQLTSILAHYGLQGGVTDTSVSQTGLLGVRFSQHHVELLQAITLTIAQEEWGESPAAPADVQRTIDGIQALADSFHFRRLSQVSPDISESEGHALRLQEHIRLHTQAVRNWGYYSRVVRISRDLYSHFDDVMSQHVGVRASNLIRIFQEMLSTVEALANERLRLMRRVAREKSAREMASTYFRQIIGSDKEAFEQFWRENSVKFEDTRHLLAFLLSHADLTLHEQFTFSSNVLSQSLGLGLPEVSSALSLLSYEPGALSGTNPEHLFLDNPVWTKPLVRISESEFYCATPQAFFSHIHLVMTSLLVSIGQREALAKRRARFLEDEVTRVLSAAFPGSQIARGVTWDWDGKRFETDVLLRIDRTLLIIEAKSGSLSPSALRGGLTRLRRHVDELILHPSVQSDRLSSIILRAQENEPAAVALTSLLPVDVSSVLNIARLSITLEDVAALTAQRDEFTHLGWFPEGHVLSPFISLADLECVTDVLSSPVCIIDYLLERARVERGTRVVGDELDWLGLYLDTGLHLQSSKTQSLLALGMSEKIDQYYTGIEAGLALDRPRPRLASTWSRLLSGLEQRKFSGYINVGLALLRSASFNEQRVVDREFLRLQKAVLRSWRNPEHRCALVLTPPPEREWAVVLYTFPPQLMSKRHESAENLAGNVFDQSRVKYCVVFGCRAERPADPYSFVHVFERPVAS